MSNPLECTHQAICKHFCPVVASIPEPLIGKEPTFKRPYNKRKPLDTNSSAEIAKAKLVIKRRIKEGKLTENQIAAFAQYKGLRVKKMNEVQKNQLLHMVIDTESE